MSEQNLKVVDYGETIEAALEQISSLLKGIHSISKRAIGLLLLQQDSEIHVRIREQEEDHYEAIKTIVEKTQTRFPQPLYYVITMQRNEAATEIVNRTLTLPETMKVDRREKLSRLMMRPVTGIPILLVVLYFGLYQFVGVFGAQILVDFLETSIFEERINPAITTIVVRLIPSETWQLLFVGEYGILTLGVRYAVALILPIVGTFFIAFSILEDSGYFPRLAMLIDRVFKRIGLTGRAVIPMILGLGCDTMATIVTRTLEEKREKVIATLLLALAIPCSAQLGVILGMLSVRPKALLIWTGIVILEFLLVGYLAAKILPGEQSFFYIEIPPLRTPKMSNVIKKTYSRMEWYFLEVFPLFILASVLIWLGQLTGIFQLTVRGLDPLMRVMGLPEEASVAFLFGFFRRDYGAAGLYDLEKVGLLSTEQLVVAAVTITLFIPCIAQFAVMLKERGVRTTAAITLFILPYAFFTGFLVHVILTSLGGL